MSTIPPVGDPESIIPAGQNLKAAADESATQNLQQPDAIQSQNVWNNVQGGINELNQAGSPEATSIGKNLNSDLHAAKTPHEAAGKLNDAVSNIGNMPDNKKNEHTKTAAYQFGGAAEELDASM